MNTLDNELFLHINQLDAPIFSVLLYVHYVGLIGLFLLAIVLWFSFPNKQNLFLKGFGLAALTYATGWIIKHLVSRSRPLENLEEVIVRADYDFASFPSNQVAVFMAVAMLLYFVFPRRWFTSLFFLFVPIICVSRIYLGAHYPSDVLGGLLLGFFVPILFRSYFKKVKKVQKAKKVEKL